MQRCNHELELANPYKQSLLSLLFDLAQESEQLRVRILQPRVRRKRRLEVAPADDDIPPEQMLNLAVRREAREAHVHVLDGLALGPPRNGEGVVADA